MGLAIEDKRVNMRMGLSGNKSQSYTIDPDAAPEKILACATAINTFQSLNLKDVYRIVTTTLVGAGG